MDCYFPSLQGNLPARLPGTSGIFYSHAGRVYYVYSGIGKNVLFLHSLGPGMSSFEWRDEYISLSRCFRVWAVDLPGFARSDKCLEACSAPVFVSFIREFIEKKIQAPVIIAASGISASFAAMAAHACRYVEGVLMSAPVSAASDYPYLKKKTVFADSKSVSDFAAACVSPAAASNKDGRLDEMNACLRKSSGSFALGSYLSGRCDLEPEYILRRLPCRVSAIASRFTPSHLKKWSGFSSGCISPHIDEQNLFEECLFSLVRDAI